MYSGVVRSTFKRENQGNLRNEAKTLSKKGKPLNEGSKINNIY